MTEPNRLLSYDSNGNFAGSATWVGDRGWIVYCNGRSYRRKTREEAEAKLKERGKAVRIEESDGKRWA